MMINNQVEIKKILYYYNKSNKYYKLTINNYVNLKILIISNNKYYKVINNF